MPYFLSMGTFLFIASDYKPLGGGIAAYVDNLVKGLIKNGNEVKVLAVVHPDEKERITFLENYENWVSPFAMIHDERPKKWIGSKFVSLLEIIRCLCPHARHLMEMTPFFQSSSHAVSILKDILAKVDPDIVVFGHLDIRLYPFALFLIER